MGGLKRLSRVNQEQRNVCYAPVEFTLPAGGVKQLPAVIGRNALPRPGSAAGDRGQNTALSGYPEGQ